MLPLNPITVFVPIDCHKKPAIGYAPFQIHPNEDTEHGSHRPFHHNLRYPENTTSAQTITMYLGSDILYLIYDIYMIIYIYDIYIYIWYIYIWYINIYDIYGVYIYIYYIWYIFYIYDIYIYMIYIIYMIYMIYIYMIYIYIYVYDTYDIYIWYMWYIYIYDICDIYIYDIYIYIRSLVSLNTPGKTWSVETRWVLQVTTAGAERSSSPSTKGAFHSRSSQW